jgi:molecular chaperone GrpE
MSKNKDNKKNTEKVEEPIKEVVENAEKESVKEEEPSKEDLLAQEKDKFLRLFAEFENYKKRTSRERLELFKTANRELMSALLPVLDDFDRALSEIKKAEDDELFKGVKLISDKFKNTLEQKGLTKMEVKQGDVFDADKHQAITQIPAPKKKLKGKIIDVTEQGYMLGDVIIRFPKVVVGN